jgi:hypothetical protein
MDSPGGASAAPVRSSTLQQPQLMALPALPAHHAQMLAAHACLVAQRQMPPDSEPPLIAAVVNAACMRYKQQYWSMDHFLMTVEPFLVHYFKEKTASIALVADEDHLKGHYRRFLAQTWQGPEIDSTDEDLMGLFARFYFVENEDELESLANWARQTLLKAFGFSKEVSLTYLTTIHAVENEQRVGALSFQELNVVWSRSVLTSGTTHFMALLSHMQQSFLGPLICDAYLRAQPSDPQELSCTSRMGKSS